MNRGPSVVESPEPEDGGTGVKRIGCLRARTSVNYDAGLWSARAPVQHSRSRAHAGKSALTASRPPTARRSLGSRG